MANWQEVFREPLETDEEEIRQCLSACGSDSLLAFLSDNPNVFHEVCKSRRFSIVDILLLNGADINTEWGGMTPLQQAAASGDVDLVHFLLEHDAELSRDVWRETSPFYLASLYGHFDVVVELTDYKPSFVKDPESRSSLFYAACKGGNLSIVKFWYLPGMDMNSPVQLITSFENCENMLPLYAACEGNQFDVAKFLFESDAAITASIGKHFPEVTAKLVEGCFHEDANEMYTGRMLGLQLGLVHPLWFEKFAPKLTTLDLSDNKLKSVPSVIPWSMPNLQILNLSNNRLQVFNGPKEQSEGCETLEIIDLSNNELVEVCPDLFCLASLTSLDLSTNKLQYLLRPSHVQPELNWSGQSKQRTSSSGNTDCEWNLPSLTHLQVCRNSLVKIPEEIRACQSLKHLDVSDNELYAFISPWNCPMHNLNLSDNFLERFPVSVEEFWSGSLFALYLQNNNLEEIGESIVKLGELRTLDVSNNKIDRLPEPSVWDCRYLEALNLANNCLGIPQSEEEINKLALSSPKSMKNFLLFNRRSAADPDHVKILEFPQQLSMCLKYLYLRNNNLDQVPLSVCRLQGLCLLDVSQNPLITTLPRELGLLTHCRDLVLSGTNIKDPGIPEQLLSDMDTSELLEHLRQLLRKCEPNNRIKLVLMGPQDKGKTTLLSLLQGVSGGSSQHGNKIRTTEWKLTARNAYQMLLPSSKPDIFFNVWELPGHPDLSIIHQCFLSQNAVYLLVFDLRKDFLHLQDWLCQIQTNAPKASVILVGTFHDKLDAVTREIKLKQLGQNIFRTFANPRVKDNYPFIKYVKPVSCATKDGINELKKLIYECATSMLNAHCSAERFLGMKIPQSYRLLTEKIARKRMELEKFQQPPVLTEEGFVSLLEELPDNEVIALDDVKNALQYLLEVGCLLHFNEQLTGLHSLYFLDPVWLQELMALIAINETSLLVSSYIIPVSQLQKRFKDKGFPAYMFRQFMQLLKRFEIAIETDNDRSLLVPSKLPKEKPVIASELSRKKQSRRIYRLYKLTYIPPGLWSRFIIRLLKATERFSQTPWFLNTETAGRRSSGEFSRTSSSRGLAIKNKDITYWREGIRVAYESSNFLVESVNYHLPDSDDLGIGILITIVSRDNHGLSAMGVIVDELDDILRDYFPSFQDFVDDLPTVHAVCPQCVDPIKDESGIVVHTDHFDVQTCALTVLNKGNITCPKGNKVPLEDVVPEMFFKELPKRFFLDSSLITVSDKSLGRGAAGAVYPGKFGESDVAIKMFHCTVSRPSGPDSVDSGSASMSTQGSQDTPIYGNMSSGLSTVNEANSLKAYKAFSEVRKEVAVLSKLRHPCIVAFLGLSVHPHLYIVMELANLGSLRTVLDKEMANRTFNKFADKHKTYSPVFSKDLTFKIIYQVAKGLQYLHEHSITYRDLKSDNVLVCSLDVKDTVNVKLSDYGISKFSTTQGLSGFVGTPGYMAPEILNKQIYTEKVDIFSFSMLMYEVVCGHLAYEECQNLMQIIQTAVKERKRPSIKTFYIVSNFPYLEYLMSVCWDHDASKRPSAADITKYMRHHQFVCQHEVLSLPDPGAVFSDVTCISVILESDRTNKKHQMWVWEVNEDTGRRYSIYNLDTSSFHVLHNPCPGADVRCMLKVAKYMWVGTEAKEIEVFGCHSVGVPQCKERLTLSAIPTVIVFYKLSDNEEEPMGHVFVGLDNGTVAIFAHHPLMRKLSQTWKLAKTLTLSEDPVSGMTLVSQGRELWVACGHMIVIVSTQTLLKEDTIDLKKDSISKKLRRNPQIQQLVSHGDMVWCSFRTSSKILEYNADLRQVMYCLDVRKSGLKCKYLSDAHQTDEAENDSDLKSDTDDESIDDSACHVPPPVVRRHDQTVSVLYDEVRNSKVVDESHYLTLIGDDNCEQHYEEPKPDCRTDHATREADSVYEDVMIGRQISSDNGEQRADYQNKTRKSGSHNQLPTVKALGKTEDDTTAQQPTPPPRPVKAKKDQAVGSESGPGSRAPPVPARKPRITITGLPDVSCCDTAPPVPARPVTIHGGLKPCNPPPLPPRGNTKRLEVAVPSQPKMETVQSSLSLHYHNRVDGLGQQEDASSGEKPPVPPRRPTSGNPPVAPRRSASKSPVRPGHDSLTQTNSLDDPPSLPPRRQGTPQPGSGFADGDTAHGNTTQQQTSDHDPQSEQKSSKKMVSSLLVVEDTLWIGTSSGQIIVVGFKNTQSDNPRPKLTAMESVSGVRLGKDIYKSGPLYMLAGDGDLVVSSARVSAKLNKIETELAAWKAITSEKYDDIGLFWKSLYREEKQLAQKNSMDISI